MRKVGIVVLLLLVILYFLALPVVSAQEVRQPELVADLGTYELWAFYDVPTPMCYVLLPKVSGGQTDIACFPSVPDREFEPEADDLGNGYVLYDIGVAQPGVTNPDQTCVIVVGQVHAQIECILSRGDESQSTPITVGQTHQYVTWIVTSEILQPRGCLIILSTDPNGVPLIQCPLL